MFLAAVGMTCLGLTMIYICMYFVVRLKEHTVTSLSGVLGVLLGGVVAKFMSDNTSAGPDTIWWYPIGLVVGLAAWVAMRLITRGPVRSSAQFDFRRDVERSHSYHRDQPDHPRAGRLVNDLPGRHDNPWRDADIAYNPDPYRIDAGGADRYRVDVRGDVDVAHNLPSDGPSSSIHGNPPPAVG